MLQKGMKEVTDQVAEEASLKTCKISNRWQVVGKCEDRTAVWHESEFSRNSRSLLRKINFMHFSFFCTQFCPHIFSTHLFYWHTAFLILIYCNRIVPLGIKIHLITFILQFFNYDYERFYDMILWHYIMPWLESI